MEIVLTNLLHYIFAVKYYYPPNASESFILAATKDGLTVLKNA